MKKHILFNVIMSISILYSCNQNKDNQKRLTSDFSQSENLNLKISNDSNSFATKSNLGYQIIIDYQDNYLGSYKRYFNNDKTKSLEEWITFDSLNRIENIHTSIVHCQTDKKNSNISFEGKLISSLEFDEAFYIISFDTMLVILDKLDNRLEFYKVYSMKELNKFKNIQIEFFTIKKYEEDTSVVSLSIYKNYKLLDLSPTESIVDGRQQFDTEKFEFVKKRFNL